MWTYEGPTDGCMDIWTDLWMYVGMNKHTDRCTDIQTKVPMALQPSIYPPKGILKFFPSENC